MHLEPYSPIYNTILNLQKTGTVIAKLSLESYGFGTNKSLVIIDLTKIGSIDNIDAIEKKYATMIVRDKNQVYYDSAIGIELKGDGFNDRQQLNLDIELWKDCPSRVDCDDIDVELFNWGVEHEDYVLRGGFLEPTLLRDLAGSVMPGKSYNATTVEVLLKIGDEYTYEGAYIFMVDIGRELYQGARNWPADGKTVSCSKILADPKEIEKVAVVFKTEHARPNRQMCSIESNGFVKMVYPKCDLFVSDPEYIDCIEAYEDRCFPFYDATRGETTVQLDIRSFVVAFVDASLIMQIDFGPAQSNYYYVEPASSILHVGTLYDFDRSDRIWATDPIDKIGFPGNDLKKLPKNKIWLDIFSNNTFINMLHSQFALDVLDEALTALRQLYEMRRQEFNSGYFDRNIERWPLFGRKTKPIQWNIPKSAYLDELEFERRRTEDRAIHIPAMLSDIKLGEPPLFERKSISYVDYFMWAIVLVAICFIFYFLIATWAVFFQ